MYLWLVIEPLNLYQLGSATFLHFIALGDIFLKELEMHELREKLNIGIPQEILELERRLEADRRTSDGVGVMHELLMSDENSGDSV